MWLFSRRHRLTSAKGRSPPNGSVETATILWTRPGFFTGLWDHTPADLYHALNAAEKGIERCVADQGGRLLNAFNGTCCAAFASTRSAYLAAEHIRRLERDAPERDANTLTIPVICGIHVGQLYYESGRAFGSAIGTAQAVCSLGWTRQIIFSDTAAALVRPHLDAFLTLEKIGSVKGSSHEAFRPVSADTLASEQRFAFISYRREGEPKWPD